MSKIHNQWISLGKSLYRGEIKNGLPHGKGEMRLYDSSIYNGEWADGSFNGFGVMVWPDGRKYEGKWHDGECEGEGKMSYPDGRVDEGYFHNGRIIQEVNDTLEEATSIAPNHYDIIEKEPTSTWKVVWDKTWRLWAALACFAGCILSVYLLVGMFTDGKSHVFNVKGLVAPVFLFFYGFYLFVEFIFHLFNIKS